MSSKIIRLSVSNLLRIEAAEINPEDNSIVIVAGRNDQGKSSLLNCIAIALSGKDLPAEPIRRGAANGHVILETEQCVIQRKFSQTGGGQLIVRDRDGEPVSSPQTKLDALYRLTTFDPLTFTRLDGRTQAATIREIAGLDTSAIDAEYQRFYEERTTVNRSVAAQRARLDSIPKVDGEQTEPIDMQALSAKLREAIDSNTERDRLFTQFSDLNDAIDSAEMQLRDAQTAVKRAEAKLAALNAQRDESRKLTEKLGEEIDIKAITEEMAQAERKNTALRERGRWTEERKALLALETQSNALTTKLTALQEQKEAQTAKAKFPIEGLGFNETGVTFEGIPFAQISSSKKIRVSLAIACALNPNLRVMLIRDGSLLDKDSMQLVREYADQHQAQVFMECVGERDDATVIIEDGNVIATPAAEAKAKAKPTTKARK